jgi:hypothetical protein
MDPRHVSRIALGEGKSNLACLGGLMVEMVHLSSSFSLIRYPCYPLHPLGCLSSSNPPLNVATFSRMQRSEEHVGFRALAGHAKVIIE